MWPLVVGFYAYYYALFALAGLLAFFERWRNLAVGSLILGILLWLTVYVPGLVADLTWRAQRDLSGVHVVATADPPKSILVRSLTASPEEISRDASIVHTDQPTLDKIRRAARSALDLYIRWLANETQFVEIELGHRYFQATSIYDIEECSKSPPLGIGLWGTPGGVGPYRDATSWRDPEPSGRKEITLPCLVGHEIKAPTSQYIIEAVPFSGGISVNQAAWQGARVLRKVEATSKYEVLAWGGCLERVRVKFPVQFGTYDYPLALFDTTKVGPNTEEIIAAAFPKLKPTMPRRDKLHGGFGCARYYLS